MHLQLALYACGYYATRVDQERHPTSDDRSALDTEAMASLSALARRPGTTLESLVQLVRGDTIEDPRPNKALRPADYRWLLRGYKHCEFMAEAAERGLRPRWLAEVPITMRVHKNHQSANRYLASVVKSIRGGQDGSQYLMVDDALLQAWPEIQVSPFGAVEKKDVDPLVEIRLIHDLSYPKLKSTNDLTDRASLPAIVYVPVACIAQRIEALRCRHPELRVVVMKGDVKGAFRHLMVSAACVRWLAAKHPPAPRTHHRHVRSVRLDQFSNVLRSLRWSHYVAGGPRIAGVVGSSGQRFGAVLCLRVGR